MTEAFGGYFWIVVVFGGVFLLGVVMAYASYQSRHRNRRTDPDRERATRRHYAEEQERLVAEGKAEPIAADRDQSRRR